MAAAMVEAIAADGHQISVSRRSHSHARRLSARFENVAISDNQTVIDNAEIVILGLLAEVATDLLPRLSFREEQQVISLMAGIAHRQVCGLVHPAKSVTIAIPFPFIAKGGSPILTYPQGDIVRALFGNKNKLFTMETEDALNAFMAAQAVMSPVLKLLEQSAGWLSERGVEKVQAEQFLTSLVGGALSARSADEANLFATMLDELNTKGGLNAELREHMMSAGMNEALIDGLERLEMRLKGP